MKVEAFLQLGPGRLRARGRRLAFGAVGVGWQQFSLGFEARAKLEPDEVLVGLVAREGPEVRWFGKRVGAGEVAISGGPIAFSALEGATFFYVTLNVRRFAHEYRAIAAGAGALADSRSARVAIVPEIAAELRVAIERLVEAHRRGDSSADLHRFLERSILALALAAIGHETPALSPRSLTRRVEAVRRCEEFMRKNLGGSITLAELSEVSRVRTRSLINAFQAVTGLSPMAYLKRQRLNEVRRSLRHPRAGTRIIDVAATWGFWHMGHFTADYRSLFGELPSATLQRGNALAAPRPSGEPARQYASSTA